MNVNNKTIIVFAILFMILILTVLLFIVNQQKVEKMAPTYETVDNKTYIKNDNLANPDGFIQSYNPPNIYDVMDTVKDYDYRKLYDPYEQPARRIARHEIHPLHLKRLIDIPSRGYPDNFTQFGILIKNHDKDGHDENKILRLFGRQEFPGSNKYEYYTMINSGLDKIKIPLYVKKQELYDGDDIYVKEMGTKYNVNLFKYDQPKYYPDII